MERALLDRLVQVALVSAFGTRRIGPLRRAARVFRRQRQLDRPDPQDTFWRLECRTGPRTGPATRSLLDRQIRGGHGLLGTFAPVPQRRVPRPALDILRGPRRPCFSAGSADPFREGVRRIDIACIRSLARHRQNPRVFQSLRDLEVIRKSFGVRESSEIKEGLSIFCSADGPGHWIFLRDFPSRGCEWGLRGSPRLYLS